MSKFEGSVDDIVIIGKNSVLFGWCLLKDEEYRLPVSYLLRDNQDTSKIVRLDVKKFHRTDVYSEHQTGFKISAKNVQISSRMFVENRYSLYAQFETEHYCVPVGRLLNVQLQVDGSLQNAISYADIIKKYPSKFKDNRDTIVSLLKAHLVDETSSVLEESTSINVRVGTSSMYGDAVIGRKGNLFLWGGTNAVEEMYGREPAQAVAWMDLLRRRVDRLTSAGMSYVHLQLPEKQSVLTELFPFTINSPSPLYDKVRRFLLSDDFKGDFCDAYKSLLKEKARNKVFRTTDTHLSFEGAQEVFHTMLATLNLPMPEIPVEFEEFEFVGDLSQRFLNGDLVSIEHAPRVNTWSFAQANIRLAKHVPPPAGKHIGLRRIWTNPDYLSSKKVLCFGNSFFGPGGTPLGLSWWFARYFKEFHFVWDPNLDYAYIDEVKPDVVVGQTIERYMNRVPKE